MHIHNAPSENPSGWRKWIGSKNSTKKGPQRYYWRDMCVYTKIPFNGRKRKIRVIALDTCMSAKQIRDFAQRNADRLPVLGDLLIAAPHKLYSAESEKVYQDIKCVILEWNEHKMHPVTLVGKIKFDIKPFQFPAE